MRRLFVLGLFAVGLLWLGGPLTCSADYPQEFDYSNECFSGQRTCIPFDFERYTRWSISVDNRIDVGKHTVYMPPERLETMVWYFDSGNFSCAGTCMGGQGPGCSGCDDGWNTCLAPPFPNWNRDYQFEMQEHILAAGTQSDLCKMPYVNTTGHLTDGKNLIGVCSQGGGSTWDISTGSKPIKIAPLFFNDAFYRDLHPGQCWQDRWGFQHYSAPDIHCGKPSQSGLQKLGLKVTKAHYCGVPFDAYNWEHIEKDRFYPVGTTADGDIGLGLWEGAPGYGYDPNGVGVFELISTNSNEGYADAYWAAGPDHPDSSWHLESIIHRMNPVWTNWFIGYKLDMETGDDFFVGWKRGGITMCEGVWSGPAWNDLKQMHYSYCSAEDIIHDTLAVSMTLDSGIATFQVFTNTVFTNVGDRRMQNFGPQLVVSSYHHEHGMVKLGIDYIDVIGGDYDPTATPTTTATGTPTDTPTGTPTTSPTATPTETSTTTTTPTTTSSPTVTTTSTRTPTVSPSPYVATLTPWPTPEFPTPGPTYTPISATFAVTVVFPTETPTSVFTPIAPAPESVDACRVWWPEAGHENRFMDTEITVCELGCLGLPEAVKYLVKGDVFNMQVCFDYYYTSAVWIFGENYVGVVQAVGLGVLILVLIGLFRK